MCPATHVQFLRLRHLIELDVDSEVLSNGGFLYVYAVVPRNSRRLAVSPIRKFHLRNAWPSYGPGEKLSESQNSMSARILDLFSEMILSSLCRPCDSLGLYFSYGSNKGGGLGKGDSGLARDHNYDLLAQFSE